MEIVSIINHQIFAMNIATNGFVFDQYGNVLLIRRDDTRTFAPPGGALDAGELPTDGCAREVREETGLIVHPVRLVSLYFQDISDGGMLLLGFRCIQRGGEITPSPESPLVAWFKTNELPDPMLNFHRERIAQALGHDGGPPVWSRYNWSAAQKFARFLIVNLVYRWKDWRRRMNGELPYQSPPAWQTAAFTIIRNEQGQVLWVRRNDKDVWNLPGGGGKPNEAPWETAVRETQEKSGLHVTLTNLTSINVYHNQPNMTFNFAADINGGGLTLGPEAANFAWFAPGAEPTNCPGQHVERVADAVGNATETVFRHQPDPEAVLDG